MTALSGDERQKLLAALRPVAEEAGRATLLYYDDAAVTLKSDNSPVTAADHAAEAIILKALRDLTPDIPVIAEEEFAAGRIPTVTGNRFWLVDPLDGTKEFLKRNGEFTVNIALVDMGVPVMGIVHVPVTGATYAAAGGVGASLTLPGGGPQPIVARQPPPDGVTVVASRSHSDQVLIEGALAGLKIAGYKSVGSSLKLCMVAAGEADVYPRLGPTMEWDIAAGHAVLLGAGGRIELTDGLLLRYGKPNYRNPPFIAYGAWQRFRRKPVFRERMESKIEADGAGWSEKSWTGGDGTRGKGD